MSFVAACLAAFCYSAAAPVATLVDAPMAVQSGDRALAGAQETERQPPATREVDPQTVPLAETTPGPERKSGPFKGGKLLLTNGVTTIEGASGGGIASFATIAGQQMDGDVGLSAHGTAIELPDFGWRSFGASVGVGNRLELSFAKIHFDTRDAGTALGPGEGYGFSQNVFGARLRLAGDLVYGPTWLPQIALGMQHKRSDDGPVLAALGAGAEAGTDFTLSATKLILSRSILANATVRYTKANEAGLLGFGDEGEQGYALHFEGSLAYQVSRRAVVGAEYRTKPDNLGLGEDDWFDIFAAYAVNRNLTLTAAYVDLGTIATFSGQRGGFVSAQVAF